MIDLILPKTKTTNYKKMLSVKNKVKEVVKEKDLNLGTDFCDQLDFEIKHLIDKASTRARTNGRVTVYARDL